MRRTRRLTPDGENGVLQGQATTEEPPRDIRVPNNWGCRDGRVKFLASGAASRRTSSDHSGATASDSHRLPATPSLERGAQYTATGGAATRCAAAGFGKVPCVTETYPQRAWTLPDDATEVLLVRHGASQAAAEGESFEMLEGHGNPPLSPEGELQA